MPLRFYSAVIAVLIGLGLFHPPSRAQTCPCGPDFCLETADYKFALQAKKKSLSKEYPARLVALFDNTDPCRACIERSPDTFSLLRRAKDGSISVDAWTAENEKIGAADLAAGSLTACRVIITRHAFECCGSQPFSQRADYDKTLDLNTTATLVCAK